MPPVLPRLLVFDLDNTLWTPELYQIRQRTVPKAGRDVRLFECAGAIAHDLATNPAWSEGGTQLAIASRTNKVDWAETLLRRFEAAPGVSLSDLFPHREIVTGSKRGHFERLRERTGIPYREMVFFDDDMRMNLGEISQMGVLCCHTPRGVTRGLFRAALGRYAEMKAQHEDGWMGYALTASDLGVSESYSSSQGDGDGKEAAASGREDSGGRRARGRVKFYSSQKRFGFVVEDCGGGGGGGEDEFFFHESKVSSGLEVRTGMLVDFETLPTDSRGRRSAAVLSAVRGDDVGESEGGRGRGGSPKKGDRRGRGKSVVHPDGPLEGEGEGEEGTTISLPCFSMSQPFASLLLNGVKTIETRNNAMLMDVRPGTRVLLHCGMRDWVDQDAPREVLRGAGLSEGEIRDGCSLPPGFERGSIVGIVEVGRTWLTAERERGGPNMKRRVVAEAADVGKYATIVERAAWLRMPVKARGFPGIQNVQVPKKCLPGEF